MAGCVKTCLSVQQEIEAMLDPGLGAEEESLLNLGERNRVFLFGFLCSFMLVESSYL